MISGLRADTELEIIRANGVIPSSSARFRLITTTAAAPSFNGQALAAVTRPSGRKAGFIWLTASRVTPARGPSSLLMIVPSGSWIGVMSSSKKPRLIAASALCWLITPYSSMACRLTPLSSATFSAVSPIEMYKSASPSAGVQTPWPPSERTLLRAPGPLKIGLTVSGRLSELPLA